MKELQLLLLFFIPEKKEGKLPISRRYDLLPLLPSDPDGVHRELAVWNLPESLR